MIRAGGRTEAQEQLSSSASTTFYITLWLSPSSLLLFCIYYSCLSLHTSPRHQLISAHYVSQERYVHTHPLKMIRTGHTNPKTPLLSRVIVITNEKICSPTDEFPSSAAFDVINSTLKADEAERKDAVSKAKAVVAFNLKNASGKEESWYLDLKDNGEVGKGPAPQGGKADGEFIFFHASPCGDQNIC